MAYDIGPKIGIEGEAKFRQEINHINTSLKTLGTEMQAVTSEFNKNDKSQENLTAQNQVLNKQIEAQSEKLEKLKQGLAQATEKYGQNDRVTQGWQQSVNKATADLNNLNRKLDENNNILGGAKSSTDDFSGSMDEGSAKADIFSGVLSGNLVSKGIEIVIGAFIEATKEMTTFFMETEAQLGKMQAQLGTTKAEAKDFGEVAFEVFNKGLDESLEGVADSVSKVKQMFGEVSDSELQSITENAYVLQDAFDIDMQEGLRGVNSLMKQFGVSSEEAFDLITKGAQNGLNQNQDLADQVAEYSVYFSDLGYSAQEFFDMMASGAVDGAFQIDYLNDVVKEFGIRTKDSSKTSAEAFSALGLNADEYFKKFAAGGTEAQEATDIVTKKLFGMSDKVKQDQIGVALFGTKWEDLGIDAVKAIMTMQNGLEGVEGSTTKASEAMYSNFTNKLEQMQRTTKTAMYELANGVITPEEFSAKMQEVMASGTETIIQNIPMFFDTGLDIIVGLANGLGDNADELVPTLYGIMIDIQQSLIEHIPEIGIAAVKIVAGLGIGMVKAVPEMLSAPPKLIGATVNALSDGAEEMKDAGKQIVVDFVDGIKSSATWLYDEVKSVFDGVVDKAKDVLGIHSPSRVFAGIGEYMAEGLGNGFVDKMKTVARQINNAIPTDERSNAISRSSTAKIQKNNVGTSTNNFNFYYPKAATPAETERHYRNTQRAFALGFNKG